MRIAPIFSTRVANATAMGQAFQKVDCQKPSGARGRECGDIFIKLAEASMENSPRGKRIDLELKQMGLI